MNKISIFCSALLLAFGFAKVSPAITNGAADGDAHPYVGLLIVESNSSFISCTGTLINSSFVLTAGHCIPDDTTGARIWFDSEVADPNFPSAGGSSIEAVDWYRSPQYSEEQTGGALVYRYDIGLIRLSAPVSSLEPAVLPEVFFIDTLPKKADVDLVGYGLSDMLGQTTSTDLARRYAPAEILPSPKDPTIIKVTANPGQGKGGACFGDSGGPNLLPGTNIVLAVNSTYTPGCDGYSSSARVDLPEVMDFIRNAIGN